MPTPLLPLVLPMLFSGLAQLLLPGRCTLTMATSRQVSPSNILGMITDSSLFRRSACRWSKSLVMPRSTTLEALFAARRSTLPKPHRSVSPPDAKPILTLQVQDQIVCDRADLAPNHYAETWAAYKLASVIGAFAATNESSVVVIGGGHGHVSSLSWKLDVVPVVPVTDSIVRRLDCL